MEPSGTPTKSHVMCLWTPLVPTLRVLRVLRANPCPGSWTPALARVTAFPWMTVVAGLMLLPAAARGQSVDSLRARYELPVPVVKEPPLPHVIPAMSANSPTAWGAGFGDFFLGGSLAARARYVSAVDGSIGGGFGLGDPSKYVALEVDLISFSTFRSGFGNRLAIDLKLHRLLPDNFAIAIGREGAVQRGLTDAGRSYYGVISKWIPLADESRPFSALSVSAGIGTGRFRSWNDWANGTGRFGLFGSVALRVLPAFSLVADWTGQDLMVLGSLAPFRRVGVVLTGGLADLTHTAGDGARLVGSAGWSF